MKIILSICEKTNTPYPRKPCYINLMNVFHDHEIYVLGDNLTDSMCSFIKSYNPVFFENKIRGRQKWISDKFQFCIDNFDPTDILYLVEDDYLHQTDSDILIEEGLQYADYVTLYDHPDKYYQHPHRNPEITTLGESTIVFRTEHSHWKYTNSTTGTFACKKQTFIDDYDMIKRHLNENGWYDYYYFIDVRSKKRKIASSIPGKSTHLHSPVMYSPFFVHDDLI